MKPDAPTGTTTDKVYICADCGSPAVTASNLTGGQGACRSCGWKGATENLLVVPIQHTMGSPEEIKHAFHAELKKIFSAVLASPLLSYLVRWGFVGAVVPPKDRAEAHKAFVGLVGRYVEAAARGASNAILETRDAIEVDQRTGGKGAPRA